MTEYFVSHSRSLFLNSTPFQKAFFSDDIKKLLGTTLNFLCVWDYDLRKCLPLSILFQFHKYMAKNRDRERGRGEIAKYTSCDLD